MIDSTLSDNEIILNKWAGDDLSAKPGDRITLKYWVMSDQRKLISQQASFTVKAIDDRYGDPQLMPDIPGLSDKKNCRDWEPGVPIDLDKIRDKDQDYWTKYRGTPKAYITLSAGQKLWNNRFGNTTSFRFPDSKPSDVEPRLKQALSPAALGVFFSPFRDQALAAALPTFDFGQLFFGFSLFLVVSALLLTALLFLFGIEQRSAEFGTLLAIGIPAKLIRKVQFNSGMLIAAVAVIPGIALGLAYTRSIVTALNKQWSDAIGSIGLEYHVEPKSLLIGAAMSLAISAFTLWLALRRQGKQSIRQLLSGILSVSETKKARKRRPGIITAYAGIVLGVISTLVGLKSTSSSADSSEIFFTAGTFWLIGLLGACRLWISRDARKKSPSGLTLPSLAARGVGRRASRSMSALTLIALGTFMVIAVGANQKQFGTESDEPGSGTGGYRYFARTTLPVYTDLNSTKTWSDLGIDATTFASTHFTQMRLKPGDEANCLNLNSAKAPLLYGVQPKEFASRKAFSFSKTAGNVDKGKEWEALDAITQDGSVPAIADENTLTWSLKLGVGDTLEYADENGRPFRIKIVGVIGNSILQGGLILSERRFIDKFPSIAGYQAFLIAAPKGNSDLPAKLSDALKDNGVDIVESVKRLNQFQSVENSFLAIFLALGGLGLVLGSLGLGLIALRNLLERRAEIALLKAIGFLPSRIVQLVFLEHAALLVLGVVCGAFAAVISTLPLLSTHFDAGTWRNIVVLTLATLILGSLSILFAAVGSVRVKGLEALQGGE